MLATWGRAAREKDMRGRKKRRQGKSSPGRSRTTVRKPGGVSTGGQNTVFLVSLVLIGLHAFAVYLLPDMASGSFFFLKRSWGVSFLDLLSRHRGIFLLRRRYRCLCPTGQPGGGGRYREGCGLPVETDTGSAPCLFRTLHPVLDRFLPRTPEVRIPGGRVRARFGRRCGAHRLRRNRLPAHAGAAARMARHLGRQRRFELAFLQRFLGRALCRPRLHLGESHLRQTVRQGNVRGADDLHRTGSIFLRLYRNLCPPACFFSRVSTGRNHRAAGRQTSSVGYPVLRSRFLHAHPSGAFFTGPSVPVGGLPLSPLFAVSGPPGTLSVRRRGEDSCSWSTLSARSLPTFSCPFCRPPNSHTPC